MKICNNVIQGENLKKFLKVSKIEQAWGGGIGIKPLKLQVGDSVIGILLASII